MGSNLMTFGGGLRELGKLESLSQDQIRTMPMLYPPAPAPAPPTPPVTQ